MLKGREKHAIMSKVATDMIKKYEKTPEAIRETLRICRDRNVLAEYLKEREAEAMSIMESCKNAGVEEAGYKIPNSVIDDSIIFFDHTIHI